MNLRYGTNPEQSATAVPIVAGHPPIRLLSGQPSYINMLDALHAWALVREAATALNRPVAASFKHVSPAGVALAGALDDVMHESWGVTDALSAVGRAYVRARDCDPKSSFGDFVAVSEPVDASLATLLATVVSDGIVAPAFEPGTVATLAAKKRGSYLVFEADPTFTPPAREQRDIWGMRLEQTTALAPITRALVRASSPTPLPATAVDDLVLAMITARHTQSNSVVYAKAGMVLGIGAGQQSRIDCTRLAGSKADIWWLRRHEAVRALAFIADTRRQDRLNLQITYAQDGVAPDERARHLSRLTDVVVASDGYIPFRDNIDEAARHGVRFMAEPGGSTRSPEVARACAEHGIVVVTTGIRLFHH